MEIKNTLRKEINDKLKGIKNIDYLSSLITKNITTSEIWKKSDKVFLFLSFQNEFKTKDLIEIGIKESKKIYAPLINGKNMSFHRIDNLKKSDFITNKFGISEPPRGLEEYFPDKTSIMLIPGVAFTKNGLRLGRGGGYYDRYLSKNHNIIKIGLTFEIQLIDFIPTEIWDHKMNIIVTEKQIYGGL